MTFFRSLLFTATVSSLIVTAACVNNKKTKQATTGTFYISQIATGTRVQVVQPANSFKLPTRTQFTFSVCLRDSGKQQPINLQKFTVEGLYNGTSEGASTTATTQSDGCLSWSEEIPFAYGLRPTYFKIERKITATGTHSGYQIATMAINPWAAAPSRSSERPILDLTVHPEDVPHGMLAEGDLKSVLVMGSKAQLRDRLSLVVNSLDTVNFEDAFATQKRESSAYPYKLHLIFSPKFQMVDMSGSELPLTSLQSGQFEMSAYIWGVTPNAKSDKPSIIKIWNTDKPVPVSIENGQINERLAANLRTPEDSNLMLAIQLRPRLAATDKTNGDVEALQIPEVTAVFQLSNDARGMSGSHSAKLVRDGLPSGQSIEQLLNNGIAPDNGKSVVKDDNAYFKVGLLEAGFWGGVNGSNCKLDESCRETNTMRRLLLTVKACPKMLATLAPFPEGRKFIISKVRDINGDENEIERPINADGCLTWPDAVDFYPYKRELYVQRTWTFKEALSGTKISRTAWINPADTWSTFFRDVSQVDTQDQIKYQESRTKLDAQFDPRLKFTSISLARQSDEADWGKWFQSGPYQPYEVFNDLSLRVHKNFIMSFTPVITKDMIRNGARDTNNNPLRDGWYQLTIVVLDSHAQPESQKRIISAYRTITRANMNAVTQSIRLPLENFKRAASANMFLVKLDPLDETKLRFRDGPIQKEIDFGSSQIVRVPPEQSYKSPTYLATIRPQANSQSTMVDMNSTALEENLNDLRDLKIRGQATTVYTLADDWYEEFAKLQQMKAEENQKLETNWTKSPGLASQTYAREKGLRYIDVNNTALLKSFEARRLNVDHLRRYIRCGVDSQIAPQLRETDCKPLTEADEMKLKSALCGCVTYQVNWLNPSWGFSTPPADEFYSACMEDRGLIAQKIIHVGAILPEVHHKKGAWYSTSVNTGFGRSISDSVAYSKQYSAMANPGILFSFASAGIGKVLTFLGGPTWAGAISASDSATSGFNDGMGTSMGLDSEALQLEVFPKHWQACLAVYVGPGAYTGSSIQKLKGKIEKIDSSLYFCDAPKSDLRAYDQAGRARLVEEYTWLAQTPSSENVLLNAQDDKNRFMFFTRGRADAYKVLKLLSSAVEVGTSDKNREGRWAPQIMEWASEKWNGPADIDRVFTGIQYSLPSAPGMYVEYRGGELRARPRNSVTFADLVYSAPIPGVWDRKERVEPIAK